MISPTNITSTSTPKDNLNYTTFPRKHKSNLQRHRFLNTNLLNSKNNYVQYASNDTDNEIDQEYFRAPQIRKRPRKQLLISKPINFEFGSNNEYTVNTATPNLITNQHAST